MSTRHLNQTGQSIIEVLIAVTVVAVVMTAIAGALTFSVKSTAEARYKAFATSFAQEGLEEYRRERAVQGWEAFVADTPAGIYCLNDLSNITAGACSGEGVSQIGAEFNRQATVAVPGADRLTVTVRVTWSDGSITREVVADQVFRQWE